MFLRFVCIRSYHYDNYFDNFVGLSIFLLFNQYNENYSTKISINSKIQHLPPSPKTPPNQSNKIK